MQAVETGLAAEVSSQWLDKGREHLPDVKIMLGKKRGVYAGQVTADKDFDFDSLPELVRDQFSENEFNDLYKEIKDLID